MVDLEHIQERLKELEPVIRQRCETSEYARLIATIPGAAYSPIFSDRKTARLCAAKFNRHDTPPRRHFETPSTKVLR